METIYTTSEVLDALGGNQPVAELTGSTPKAVSNWRKSTFPANTYVSMTRALKRIGKTAPTALWGMKSTDLGTVSSDN